MLSSALIVRATWDSEAEVWVAVSPDLPGLVTESASLEDLRAKLKTMIPDLLEARGELADGPAEIPLVLLTEQVERVRLHA
jgi:predicted RNase H-like HicB family nuclease